MAWIDLDIELQPYIRQGNLEHCIDHVSKAMKALAESPFHQILDLKFTNKPQKVAKYFKKFINREKKRIQLKAVYTETNGFCINPDRWFFDLFAYESYGGHENYDWLSVWQSKDYPSMTLTGMESLQEVYDSEAFRNKRYNAANHYCSFLVVLRFQYLIRESASLIENLHIPILATSHDYDFIYEYTGKP